MGALDWCRPDYFGTVEMTFSALGSKKKKKKNNKKKNKTTLSLKYVTRTAVVLIM